MNILIPILCTMIFLGGIFFLFLATRSLGKESVVHLWGASYVYALAICLTCLLMLIANRVDAFDKFGRSTNAFGKFILFLFSYIGNINNDLRCVSGIAAVIVFPQFLVYFWTGLCGYAPRRLIFSPIVKVWIYFISKTTLIFSGFSLVAVPYAASNGWIKEKFSLFWVSIFSVGVCFLIAAFSFFLITLLSVDINRIIQRTFKILPNRAHNTLKSVHLRFIREHDTSSN